MSCLTCNSVATTLDCVKLAHQPCMVSGSRMGTAYTNPDGAEWPPICVLSSPDIVLRGQRLENGDGECQTVRRLPHHLFGEQPGL